QRSAYQKQVAKLSNALLLYHQLKSVIQPEETPDFVALVADYQASMTGGLAALRARQAGQAFDQATLDKFVFPMQMFQEMAEAPTPLLIPPLAPERDRNAWQNMGASLINSIQSREIHPAVSYFARMATAYHRGDAAEFNSAMAGYKNWLAPKFAHELSKGRAEYYFNQVKAFLHATIIYIFAFVLAGAALLTLGVWPQVSES